MQDTKLAIVIPCFNEALNLPVSLEKLWNILHRMIDDKNIRQYSTMPTALTNMRPVWLDFQQ